MTRLSDPVVSNPFFVESGAVMQRLRTSISEMVRALPTRVRTTRDLQKSINVDVKLCWQVLKLAGPGEALTLTPFVPTPGPMRRFLTAAKSAGIEPTLIARVSSAYDAFKEQVTIHAGDRSTFETMTTGVSGGEDAHKSAVRLRKGAYQAASHYAGVQMDTYLGASIIAPGTRPDRLDAAFLRVKLGVRRLRPAANFVVDQVKLGMSDQPPADFRRGTFDDAAAARYGAPILTQFSSDPLPQFETTTDADGRTLTRILGDGVGQKNAVDLVFGRTVHNAPYTPLYGGTRRGFVTSLDLTAPNVVVILDKLVHRPTFPKLDTEFTATWANAPASPSAVDRDPGLPFTERLVRLDAGVDGARTHEVPNYVEMLQFVCDQCRWNIDDFDVYRLRIEYPLQFTRLWTRFAVPE